MKIYVAAPFSHHVRAKAFAEALVKTGHEITQDWWKEAIAYPEGNAPFEVGREHALQDLRGVMIADLVVALTSEHKHEGCGMFWELGAAVASGVPFMVVGPQRDRSIFARLGLRIDTDERALKAIERFPRPQFGGPPIEGRGRPSAVDAYIDIKTLEARLKEELASIDHLQGRIESL